MSSYSTSEYDVRDVNIPRTGRLFEVVKQEWNWRKWRKPLLAVLMLLVFVATGITLKQNKTKRQIMVPTSAYGPVEIVKPTTAPSNSVAKPATTKKVEQVPVEREPMEKLERLEVLVPVDLQGLATELQVSEPVAPEPQTGIAHESDREKTTLELLEERNHANVVESTKRAGVSTEGTTAEIQERISRKQMENWR